MKAANITIRTATLSDAARLLDIYRPYVEQTAITFEYETPDVETFAGRIAHTLKKYPYLVAEADGCLLGYAYVGAFHERPAYDWSVETSIYVRRDAKRAGIGRRLYDALEAVLKEQGILNLYACVACPDGEGDEYLTRDSIRFHEKLGYRIVGEFRQCGYKFNRWYHMVWLEKCIGSHTDCQTPVKPFPEIKAQLHL